MTSQGNRRNGIFRRPQRAVGWAAVSIGVVTAATTLAAPAQADPAGDAFLSALSNAGVGYNDPANTVALGQSICPMLSQPGGSFASVASSVAGNNSMSPDMAGMFTSIAISMFCPAMVSNIASGNFLNTLSTLQLPGI
jgi:Protein of unknown function (DUF732)